MMDNILKFNPHKKFDEARYKRFKNLYNSLVEVFDKFEKENDPVVNLILKKFRFLASTIKFYLDLSDNPGLWEILKEKIDE